MNRLGNMMRELGPYTAIALILPGGSLIALAAWTVRHRSHVTARLGRLLVLVAALGVALILPAKALTPTAGAPTAGVHTIELAGGEWSSRPPGLPATGR